jgi:hypothetical protein
MHYSLRRRDEALPFLRGDAFGSRFRSRADEVVSPLGRDNLFSEIEMKENNKIPLASRDRVTDVDQVGISGADYVICARGAVTSANMRVA